MSRQASPAVIGGFVVGALVLAIVGVFVFGSGKFFADIVPAVMYFEGDIKGLRVGASVDFQGVQVGTVSDIKAVFDPKELRVHLPVIVQMTRDKLEWVGERPEKATMFRQLIERGARAQLQLESMVTGQLFIQLDFHPEAPPAELQIDPLTQLPEIPTIPTAMQEVQQTVRNALEKLGELPLEEIVNRINTTLRGIDHLVNAPEVMEAVKHLNTMMTDIQQLVRNIDTQVAPVATGATEALGGMKGAMADIGKLARNADGHVATLTSSVTETVGAARTALASAQETLRNVNGLMAPNAPVGYELVKTLRELSEAARSLRVLADLLERNPDAILFGRNEVKTP
ncbi:MAG: MlaD family protein [Candidatus Binatia bacterium]